MVRVEANVGLVVADRLIDSGRIVEGADGVLVDGRRIGALVAGRDPAIEASSRVTHRFPGSSVLPGLIDAHVHTCLVHGEDLSRAPDEAILAHSLEAGLRAASGMLAAGVTAARDLGARGTTAQRLRDGLRAGDGPRLVVAGRPITAPGGHFASFGLVASGPAALRRAVDRLVDEGCEVVKIMLTGGMLTPGTFPGRAQFELDEVRALTDRAHDLGRTVAAHAHGTAGVAQAVAAGVDTIEHCSWMSRHGEVAGPDDHLVEEIARRGQVVVIAGPLPPAVLAELEGTDGAPSRHPDIERLRRVWSNAAHLRDAGIRVALGSDSLFGQFGDFGDLASRAQAMARLGGWAPSEVIELITEGGAAALGLRGEIGRLVAGARADLVVVAGDPSTDPTALRRVVAVYRDGRLVAGAPPSPQRGMAR